MTVKKRLGEMLLEAGVIDETQLQAALGHQRKWGGRLGQALQDLKLATEPQVVSALSRKFGYSTVNVGALPRTPPLEAGLEVRAAGRPVPRGHTPGGPSPETPTDPCAAPPHPIREGSFAGSERTPAPDPQRS